VADVILMAILFLSGVNCEGMTHSMMFCRCVLAQLRASQLLLLLFNPHTIHTRTPLKSEKASGAKYYALHKAAAFPCFLRNDLLRVLGGAGTMFIKDRSATARKRAT
jgi:hypothetical protein